MFLSRLTFDLRSREARRDLSDPYDMHRSLVRAFVRSGDETPPRFLWRQESDRSSTTLLVQSEQAADWAVFDAWPGYLAKHETRTFEPERLIQMAGEYQFRLLANPTVTREGKRRGLVSPDAQLHWLARQGERLGFEVLGAMAGEGDVLQELASGKKITLLRVCFDGQLRVTDAQRLSQALASGIGPGKAFGCGLLSVARI